jgi:hypothetical protein
MKNGDKKALPDYEMILKAVMLQQIHGLYGSKCCNRQWQLVQLYFYPNRTGAIS